MGFHKFFRGHSDKMWQNGKKLLKYIVERGGRIGQSIEEFRITDSDVHGLQVCNAYEALFLQSEIFLTGSDCSLVLELFKFG